jgi:hypothetical protein
MARRWGKPSSTLNEKVKTSPAHQHLLELQIDKNNPPLTAS